MAGPERTLALRTTTALVVASMVGTGVFTTTGYLIADLRSAPAVLLGWALGGVAACCGALAYGELAAALPDNGGEYALLSRIYHPALGFVAGVVSLFVGFAAPIAAGAIAFGAYAERVFPGGPAWWPPAAGCAVIVLASLLHARTVRRGSFAQDLFTALKIVLLVALALVGIAAGDGGRLAHAERDTLDALLSPELAVGLVYISFAYTGWNAAAYVAGEARDPERTLPRALVGGTAIVTLLYLALNAAFLMAADADALAGEVEVGHVAAAALFGEDAARALSAVIAIGLLSTVGAMVLTGARIYEAMGRHHPRLAPLARRSEGGGPSAATALQAVVAIAMALSTTFDALLIYCGVCLSLLAMLTAGGVFVLRRREPDLPRPYRTSGHPWTTLVFLLLSAWMIAHSVIERPLVAAFAAGTMALGFVAWAALGRRA